MLSSVRGGHQPRFHAGGAAGAGPAHCRHPRELPGPDLAAFLNYLVPDRRLGAASQNQALNAFVFLFPDVLGDELGPDHVRPFASARVRPPGAGADRPVGRGGAPGLGRDPAHVPHRLMAELPYGCGLRLSECCTLRVRDSDFDRRRRPLRRF